MSFSVKRWENAETIKLINLYKSCECLWNFRIPEYKLRTHREKALKFILKKMDLPFLTLEMLKKKIKSIRDTYTMEKSKVKKSMRSGGEIYQPRLIWFYKVDNFLGMKKEASDSHTHLTQSLTNSLNQTNGEEVTTEDEILQPRKIGVQRKIIQQDEPSTNTEAITRLVEIESSSENADEFYYFGMNVAQQLRNLPIERALNLQGRIHQMIIQERLNNEHSKKLNTDGPEIRHTPVAANINCNSEESKNLATVKVEVVDINDNGELIIEEL